MSSVLAVKYKETRRNLQAHLPLAYWVVLYTWKAHFKKSSFQVQWELGYHSNQYVLGSLDTDGDYKPQFCRRKPT